MTAEDTPWTLKTASFALIFTIIAIPFWVVYAPIYVIIKTLATVFQPYLYKKQRDEWNKMYQEYLKKGIHIDYPPTEGTLFGIGPWRLH